MTLITHLSCSLTRQEKNIMLIHILTNNIFLLACYYLDLDTRRSWSVSTAEVLPLLQPGQGVGLTHVSALINSLFRLGQVRGFWVARWASVGALRSESLSSMGRWGNVSSIPHYSDREQGLTNSHFIFESSCGLAPCIKSCCKHCTSSLSSFSFLIAVRKFWSFLPTSMCHLQISSYYTGNFWAVRTTDSPKIQIRKFLGFPDEESKKGKRKQWKSAENPKILVVWLVSLHQK